MDKIVYIIGLEDLFDVQKLIYQCHGYYNCNEEGELSYGRFTRHICEAKIFNNKKAAKKFIKARFQYPDPVKIIPINGRKLFQLRLIGT